MLKIKAEEKEKKREESAKHFEAWRADIDKKLRAKVNEARAKRLAEVKAKQEEAAESKKDAESAFKAGNTFFCSTKAIFLRYYFSFYSRCITEKTVSTKNIETPPGMEKQEGRK